MNNQAQFAALCRASVAGAARCGVVLALTCGMLLSQTTRQAPARAVREDAEPRPGLVTTCRDSRHAIQMVTPSVSFSLAASESLHPALETSFECDWRGSLEVLQAGLYEIDRDGAQVWIAGEEIDDRPRQLTAGRHSILVRYRRSAGPAKVRARWKSERFAWEPLPGSRLTHAAAEGPSAEQMLIARGRRLVEEYGCANCHEAASQELERRQAPSLAGIGSRIQSGWLRAWLEDPKALRGDARMPRMLDEASRQDVAAYLMTLRRDVPGADVAAASKEGADDGARLMASLGCRACHGEQGVRLDGLGSKFAFPALVEYLRQPAEFEPSGRMPSMLLDEREAAQIAAYLAQSKNPAVERSPNAGDAERGSRLFETAGCAACHKADTRRANRLEATAWADLRAGRGCLSESAQDTPRYGLSAQERAAIEAFLASYQRYPDVSRAPVFAFRRTIERLRCNACHTIDDTRPAEGLAEAPPPLTDAGAKLRPAWLEGVLTGHNRALHWMELRMPHYEAQQVRDLIDGFAKAAGVEPGEPAQTLAGDFGAQNLDALQQRGHDLLGTNSAKGGMACIGCHDWGERKALGEHGPQLLTAAQRLRADWFKRWMLDPARILSGTSMPNYFSSTQPDEAAGTIAALWAALEKGAEQPPPEGFEVDVSADPEAKPVPVDRPIVVRWDMPEATPAAIAVGFPGGVSYCFDAGESRLRYAWRGGFVDLSGTLLSKRDPESKLSYTAALVGEIFYRSESFPIRIGQLEEIPQRRFRGYRLIEGYPEFHYEVDGIEVRERITVSEGRAGMVREFRFGVVEQPMWLLPGEGVAAEISFSVGDRPAGDDSAGSGNPGPISIPTGRNVTVRLTIFPGN